MAAMAVTAPASASHRPLPPTTATVSVQLLDGGSFMADTSKLHANVPNERMRLYNWAFLVRHPDTKQNLLWDMGMSGKPEDYTPFVTQGLWEDLEMAGPRRSLVQQIREEAQLEPDDVDTVVLSHAHFDHCRPISTEFPRATALFGPGTQECCMPGHLQDPSSQWDGRYFDPHQSTERWAELQGPWVPFGPFDQAIDYFQDGSFWIIRAPGHMPGNLCAAARVHGGHWIVLGSDCCHSREIYKGIHDFGYFALPDGRAACLHADVQAARDTIERITIMETVHGAHIAFAHDASWMVAAEDPVLMSLLGERLQAAARERIPFGEVA